MQVEGTLQDKHIEHLVFTICGNNCYETLKSVPEPENPKIKSRFCGAVVVSDHQAFIEQIFDEACNWAQPISIQQVKLEASALQGDTGLYGAGYMAIRNELLL